ncbi:MAG TPA: cyclopropane-fatty-acyl-phospholipid synthase family protein [Mycobacteriales bacterium]|nr:cyclopropane-fatty-acyl-phospholipid synthase family protein [Mycobacteriales bacterium]
MTRTAAAPLTLPVDAVHWPDVATVPARGARSTVGGALFKRAAKRLRLRILMPDGSEYGGGDTGSPVMRLRRPEAMYRRIGATGTIGFGEAYMAGDWDTNDLVGVLTAFAQAVGQLVPMPLQTLRHRILTRIPTHERNTVAGARSNISRHYDLSNEMFATFLDPTMTYSSALFAEVGGHVIPGGDIRPAQHAKIDRLLDLARVGAGTRLLEIGTGWGELATRAAARGAQVHTVTISAEQAALATQRVAAAGQSDRVRVDLRDYRQLEGEYDAIVSVEMIEAVGAEHVAEYVRTLDRHLAPGGRVGLQAITMPHDRMLVSQDTYTWIRKYIFPGGQILSVPTIERGLAENTGLRISEQQGFGLHYAETLRQWRETFLAHTDRVQELGFDQTFIKMWEFYLAYSEAGFRARYLDVYQLLLTRPGDDAAGA